MKILMVTNTYTPIVGGVEQSITSFTKEFRKLGHDVLILAPEFDDAPIYEPGVVRVAAIRRFNGSDFSVRIAIPAQIHKALKNFKPDIVHSHHPFLLGDTALRIANKYQVPLVFTHHTKFEDYTHYVPGNSESMKKIVIELSTGYAQLADHVVAPSQSISDLITSRGVTTPVSIVPTGVDIDQYSQGNGKMFRQKYHIGINDYVIGHVGRLASEKNLILLCGAVVNFLKSHQNARFLIVGDGSLKNSILENFKKEGLSNRLCMTGVLRDQALIDAYHAMDVFAFASLTETQGVVLLEAMAASTPVVAIDASGVREVMKDKFNGRMMPHENKESLIEGLNWVYKCSQEENEKLKFEARKSAEDISIRQTAQTMLNIYDSLISKNYVYADIESSLWAQAVGRLKTEWDLASNVADAIGSALYKSDINKNYSQNIIVKCKRWFNRNEWAARLLGLSQSSSAATNPGLILVQIDGLSKKHLEDALKKGHMPFVKRLLRKEHYELNSFYSGQPSSTPGVQAELFYGVKGAVPSFSFLDNETRKIFKMIDDESALIVEKRLKAQGDGLLVGGSSYSNIYSGGALESHFCSVDLGWDKVWLRAKPIRVALLAVIHSCEIILIAFRVIWELIVSIYDCLKGLNKGKHFRKELMFIPTRLALCIILRDFITFGAKVDIIRGLPIIHLNFIGYDEHAHRRGPSSMFAHATLRGIDRCIAKIHKESLRSTRRIYDVWIYSDHGQEDSCSYVAKYKNTVADKIQETFSELVTPQDVINELGEECIQSKRIRYLDQAIFNKTLTHNKIRQARIDINKLVVTAMGPVGHIYLPQKLKQSEQYKFAQKLVTQAKIPLVLMPSKNNRVIAWNSKGRFNLPDDAKHIFGTSHPFLNEVTEDIMRICNHINAGEFVISGWMPGQKPLSFPAEGGSHGGPGINETDGFALIPNDILIENGSRSFIRPLELRNTALKFLGRSAKKEVLANNAFIPAEQDLGKETIRVMTYNVHGCRGMDGRISVERIARVIAQYNPDIVALQELDINRGRSGQVDQPHLIAKSLEMIHQFYPSVLFEGQEYGNAVLSRYPMKCIKTGLLPGVKNNEKLEVRGAIWTEVTIHNSKIQFINTHLGLNRLEQRNQTDELLGENWLNHPFCKGPVILSGDFNAPSQSYVCRQIRKKLFDAQIKMVNHKPKATWFGYFPLTRIDHVFLGSDFEVMAVEVAQTALSKIASDHLPLIIDVKIKKQNLAGA